MVAPANAAAKAAEPAPSGAFIAIPGQQTFWKTVGIPPERVALPIVARARFGLIALLGIAPLLGLATATILSIASLMQANGLANTTAALFGLVVASLGLAVAGGTILVALLDRISPDRRLSFGPGELSDGRILSSPVEWTDVVRATLLCTRGGYGAVRLELRGPVAARFNPFRPGSLLFTRPIAPNEIVVPVLAMSVPSRTLALAIMTLVRDHGGIVDGKNPMTGEDALRHH